MSTLPKQKLTPEEYLAIERRAEYKSEYFAGEMFAMTGASRWHNLIVSNLLRIIGNEFLDRPCVVFPSDMRVKVSPTGLYTYPDVSALCGDAEFEDEEQDTLTNPTVVFEVLSKSTEGYDRGKKFEHYRKVDSLRDYVLVAQDKTHVEHFSKRSDGRWLLTEWNELSNRFQIESIDCSLNVEDIYAKVEFES